MDLHANAALSLNKRRLLARRVVEERWTLTKAAAAAEVSVRCARKWVRRYRSEGEFGPARSLLGAGTGRQPHARRPRRGDRLPAPTALHGTRDRRVARHGALDGLGHPHAHRDGQARRLGLEPARRYERARPGELVHVDVKRLGRIQGGAGKRVRDGLRKHYNRTFTDRHGKRRKTAGWQFVHIAIDDCSRLAYAEVLPDEKATTAIAFLRRAVAFFERHGIKVERLLTDNGSAYRSTVHELACRALGIRHLRTRPYRPQTNGKAERFIRTLLGGWAYGAIYRTSTERTAALDGWLWHYNHHRRHSALSHKPPIARLNERTNLLGTYI